MNTTPLLIDTLFLKNDTLYSKFGEIVMTHKYVTENDGCWTNVVIWFMICIVIIWLAYLITSSVKMRKDKQDLELQLKKEKEKLSKNDSEQEEANAIYRSKVLDFMEKEMTSCEKIYHEQKKQKEEIESLIKKAYETINKFENNSTQAELNELQTAVGNLSKALEEINLSELKASIDGLLGKMKNEKAVFADSSYLITLNSFLKGDKGIDSLFTK